MSQQIVPLTTDPNQTLTVTLSVDGSYLTLRLRISFNSMAGYWIMNISDQYGKDLYIGIPLVTGSWPAANLLGQQQYLKIGSCYLINISQSPTDSPNSANLGSDFVLLWDDTPA